MSAVEPEVALAPVARLLGRLLVREVDDAALGELRRSDIAAALAGLGVELPEAATAESLGEEFCEAFLHPRDALPPVESLHLSGQYDGPSKVGIEAIAAAAGFESGGGARGAPVDHVGAILALYAEIVAPRPDLAAILVRDHLGFAERALAPASRGGGFYGGVATAAATFVRELREPGTARQHSVDSAALRR